MLEFPIEANGKREILSLHFTSILNSRIESTELDREHLIKAISVCFTIPDLNCILLPGLAHTRTHRHTDRDIDTHKHTNAQTHRKCSVASERM